MTARIADLICGPAVPPVSFYGEKELWLYVADSCANLGYHPPTRMGVRCHLDSGLWMLVGPVDFVGFVGILAASGLVLPATEAGADWAYACGGIVLRPARLN